ncbi:uncharacterized protein SETTUDRAFT_159469 [Exserohilum turcica Et28A]|uniref:Uncharacterized protein n=1 Tax=Exserohilum turcicum (strain 28A) TaxID=671987 RepID=R0KAB2_EXST2|nr:uncharacterized protein SETTUDRAFT_159469 [Exserohilum turcica Et28A]EOA89918.1 hypothetical protein SETTUDRAFT_159469 [Exserohilum turcica Et28A]
MAMYKSSVAVRRGSCLIPASMCLVLVILARRSPLRAKFPKPVTAIRALEAPSSSLQRLRIQISTIPSTTAIFAPGARTRAPGASTPSLAANMGHATRALLVHMD